jgi:hypothetical protein
MVCVPRCSVHGREVVDSVDRTDVRESNGLTNVARDITYARHRTLGPGDIGDDDLFTAMH